jgi:peptidoglycan/LPS O-acetylase OafA/YrhL
MSPLQLEFHPLLSIVYAISIYGCMLLFAKHLLRLNSVAASMTATTSRYGYLDGLRGLLATGVLVHHTFTAHRYFVTGEWVWSTMPVPNQLGQTTVTLFFMITGFLFTLKAIRPQLRWKALYLSRVARLWPLYAAVVVAVFALILIASRGVPREPATALLREFLLWITFTCFGSPDINTKPMTWTMIAGVSWTLKYEVIFYLAAIPAIHLLSRWLSTRMAGACAAIALALLLILRQLNGNANSSGNSLYAAHFLCGILVAYAFEMPRWRALIALPVIRWLAVAAALSLLTMTNAYSAGAVLATITIFAAVVGGASVFGLLGTRAAIWLGDISYGIYLLHGLMLWILFTAIQHRTNLGAIALDVYWPMMLLVSVGVVALASLSYVVLEKPIMRLSTGERSRAKLAP